MTFTPLEMLLISFLVAVMSGIAVRVYGARVFMTRAECIKNHLAEQVVAANVGSKIENIDRQMDLVFRMIRGLVVYSDFDKETKEKILNERGQDNAGCY